MGEDDHPKHIHSAPTGTRALDSGDCQPKRGDTGGRKQEQVRHAISNWGKLGEMGLRYREWEGVGGGGGRRCEELVQEGGAT